MRRLPTILSLAWLTCCAWSAGAQGAATALTITLDADSTEANAATGEIRFSGVTISQGTLSVRAATARSSSLDFAASTWVFEGNVRFASADTRLEAERAELRFVEQTLQSARLTGAPLRFEQSQDGSVRLDARTARLEFRDNAVRTASFEGKPVTYVQTAGDSTVRSRAERLNFDADAGMITLQGDAWIGDDGKEISGNSIKYNFRTRSYVAASDEEGDQRVTITITPPANGSKDPN